MEHQQTLDFRFVSDSAHTAPATVLVITPATRFGSWSWLEKVIAATGEDARWVVVSYGRPDYEIPHVTFRTLPSPVDYPRLGRLLSHRLLLWINALYLLPLAPLAWWSAVRHRTRVVVANGVVSAAVAAPLGFVGCRLLLAYHGTVGHAPAWIHRTLRVVLGRFDAAFVNSTGSADDLSLVIDRARVQVVPLWADSRFFAVPLERETSERLDVLFVGRQDPEKFEQCLRVCSVLATEGLVRLRAVGAGPLADRVHGNGLEQLGYISDVEELAHVYGRSDVVWAPADVTYLSIPGVEALASGCPVIVSDRVAVDVKADVGVRVARDLVLPPLGIVVGSDDEALVALRSWAETGIDEATRRICRDYAEEHHSDRNLRVVVDAITKDG